MPFSLPCAQVRAVYLSYKAATRKIKSWLGLAEPCTCREILEHAKTFQDSGRKMPKWLIETLSNAIQERMQVSEALRPRFQQDDTEWMNHNHFIAVLQEVQRLLSDTKQSTGNKAELISVTVQSETVHLEERETEKNEAEQPESHPNVEIPPSSTNLALSAAQLDSEADDLEDLLNMVQKCAEISDSVSHIWKQVLDSQLDFVSAATVMNCAYRDIKASMGAAKIMRDVWGNELDDRLSNLAIQFGISAGLEFYNSWTLDTPMDQSWTHGLSMLGYSLNHQKLHTPKFPVPFFRDMIDHLGDTNDGQKMTIIFGLQLYANMVLSILPDARPDVVDFSLGKTRILLANTYVEAINSLIHISCADPNTCLETMELIKSLGIHLDGIKPLPARISGNTGQFENYSQKHATVSSDLDIWSLGHHIGRLHTFCTKLVIFNHLHPRSSPGIFSFLYKLNAALFRAGCSTDYTLRAKFSLDAQEMLVFRQKRPTSMEELLKCLKNVIVPGVNDTNNSSIRKVHAKRCQAISEDVSSSLICILHTNKFGITNDIHELLANNKRKDTASIYHGLAMELMHQMENTYNGVSVDFAARAALASISQGNEEVTATSLRADFRNTSPARAKEIAAKLQEEFYIHHQEPGHYFLPRMPIPRIWLITEPKLVLRALYFSSTPAQFNSMINLDEHPVVRMTLNVAYHGDPGGLADLSDPSKSRNNPCTKMLAERFGIHFYAQLKDENGRDAHGLNPRIRTLIDIDVKGRLKNWSIIQYIF